MKKRGYRECDQPLYDSLRDKILDDAGAIRHASRHLDSLLESGILPADTLYFDQPLEYLTAENRAFRLMKREAWVAASRKRTQEADIVFLDPDNGIECASVGRHSQKGPKYVYWDDMAAFLDRGQSLVVYHHLNRSAKHAVQVESMLEEIRLRFSGHEPLATVFRRGSGRAYLIIPSATRRILLGKRLARFASGRWKDHFVAHQSNPSAHGSGADGLL